MFAKSIYLVMDDNTVCVCVLAVVNLIRRLLVGRGRGEKC